MIDDVDLFAWMARGVVPIRKLKLHICKTLWIWKQEEYDVLHMQNFMIPDWSVGFQSALLTHFSHQRISSQCIDNWWNKAAHRKLAGMTYLHLFIQDSEGWWLWSVLEPDKRPFSPLLYHLCFRMLPLISMAQEIYYVDQVLADILASTKWAKCSMKKISRDKPPTKHEQAPLLTSWQSS